MPKKDLARARTGSRRAASKEALKQMQVILGDEEDAAEVISDDDVSSTTTTEQSHSSRKKYKLSHRKSSDGDREVLVLKTITNRNAENTLELECWPEELSEAQLARQHQLEREDAEIALKISELLGDGSSAGPEIVYRGERLLLVNVATAAPQVAIDS